MHCLIKNANEAAYNYTLTDMELDEAARLHVCGMGYED